jgi:hypothetical protein
MVCAVQGTIFFAIGVALIALALLPELRAQIADRALFIGLSAMLLAAGLWQLTAARRFADEISQKMADASALRRFWLPAQCYSRHILLWQFRITSAAMIGLALLIAFLAFRRGL